MTVPRRILVAGGSGFVGAAIVARLVSDGYEVAVLTRGAPSTDRLSTFQLISGDMLVPTTVPLEAFDVFVNCAGELTDKARMRPLHVDAVRMLIRRIEPSRRFRWVQLSSVGVYGRQQEGMVTEDAPFAPIGEYETTKAEGETLVRDMCRDRDIAYTILRPSNVFGVGMPNRSLAQLIRSIERGVFVHFGDPTRYRMNYVHVDDVAACVSACVGDDRSTNEVFNVSDSIDQRAFVEIVKRECGVTGRTHRVPLALVKAVAVLGGRIPGFPLTPGRVDALTVRACYSIERLRSLLRFNHVIGLENGLAEYVRSLKSTASS